MTAKKVQIKNDSVTIHYYQAGKGERTLIFLHGWCINGKYWESQLAYFQEKYAVYAIDLPGFGQSKADRTNWTIEDYASDVISFIDALELKNVVLIGHSMSGEIVLEAALQKHKQVRAIIGVDNFKFVDVEWPEEAMQDFLGFFEGFRTNFKEAAPAYAAKYMLLPATPNEVQKRVKNDLASADPAIGFSSFSRVMEYSQTEAQKLEQLSIPFGLVSSDAVPTNEGALAKRLKNGYKLKHVHATGHYPMIEKPNEFNQRLEELLEEIK